MTSIVIENGAERSITEAEEQSLNEIRLAFEKQQQSMQANFVREERNKMLSSCDWIIAKAVEQNAKDNLGVQIPQVWLDYRQALRDIPAHRNFPNLTEADWPTKPE